MRAEASKREADADALFGQAEADADADADASIRGVEWTALPGRNLRRWMLGWCASGCERLKLGSHACKFAACLYVGSSLSNSLGGSRRVARD